jgi:hypothetical protein
VPKTAIWSGGMRFPFLAGDPPRQVAILHARPHRPDASESKTGFVSNLRSISAKAQGSLRLR